MKIGIDISQLAYPNTGVAKYTESLVEAMLQSDDKNDYILFFSSLRGSLKNSKLTKQKFKANVTLKTFPFPPTLLDFVWNKLHIFPIELFLGNLDLFITSDWTEPPTKNAKKGTIIHDLIVYKMPNETDIKILSTQKRKLAWVKKETDIFLCNSEATQRDAVAILGISKDKTAVIYPGI